MIPATAATGAAAAAAAAAATAEAITTSAAATPTWSAIRAQLEPLLKPHGLDVLHPFCAQRINTSCPCNDTSQQPLPTFGRRATLALLIGNSAALWRPFVAWLAADHPARADAADPLDAYVEASIAAALSKCPLLSSTAHHVRHSHDTGALFVNVARAAELSGLAHYSSTTHLCWHPTFGPWFALRAVVVLDAACDEAILQQAPLPCPYPDVEAAAAEHMARLLQLPGGRDGWRANWRQWAALREIGGRRTDACYRYGPQQLAYHYTRERSILHQEAEAARQSIAAADGTADAQAG